MSEWVRQYIPRPIVTSAIKFDAPLGQTVAAIEEWAKGAVTVIRDADDENPTIAISTTEGTMTASVGDYIVKDSKGNFYPVKPDVFEYKYVEVGYEGLDD